MKTKLPMLSKLMKIAFFAILIGLTAVSCNKNKKIAKAAPDGEVLINEYCSTDEFFSDKKFFRSTGLGESMDQATAKKKALSNARADMASSIQTTIKGTVDNYINSREFNNREEVEERFEGLTREVINQELSGVKTICQKAVRVQSNNNYKYYVALELSGEDLVQAINERLSNDERLKVDYDYEKFKETFNKEMEQMENR